MCPMHRIVSVGIQHVFLGKLNVVHWSWVPNLNSCVCEYTTCVFGKDGSRVWGGGGGEGEGGEVKTPSSRKTRKPRRISFPRFSAPSFPFCTIPQTEKSELKTSEICSELVSSNSEVLWSNSEVFQLRLFHFAPHSKRKTRR